MSLYSACSQRLLVTGALGLFWAVLLIAVGVPPIAVVCAALLGCSVAGLVRVVREWADLSTKVFRLARRLRPRWPAAARPAAARALRSAREVRPRLFSLARSTAARVRGLPWASARSRAYAHWHRALKSVAREPNPLEQARRLNQLSASLRQQGRTAEALDRSEAALALSRELGNQRGEALSLNSMALALARRGDAASAIARFEEALELLAALGDAHSEGQVLANIGGLKRREGDEEQARSCWRNALVRLDPESPEHRRLAAELRLAS